MNQSGLALKDKKVFDKGKRANFSYNKFKDYLHDFIFLLVSRISGKSEVFKLGVELDVNTDIYPMQKGVHYSLVLANSLTANGNEEFDLFAN